MRNGFDSARRCLFRLAAICGPTTTGELADEVLDVWRSGLTPGKYALNPYAVKVELVPTLNFVLRWNSGQTEAHHTMKT